MYAECKSEVMTYISISKPAGHVGKASKIRTCVHMDYVSLVWESPSRIVVNRPCKSQPHEKWTQTLKLKEAISI